MRPINPSKQAQKFIERLPKKQKLQIAQKLMDLRLDRAHDVKRLHGTSEPYLRVDVGEYRIIYRYEQETVVVAVIGKRNDDEVYRRFARKGG